MQLISPATIRLYTTGTPVYVSSEWAAGQAYTANASIVRIENPTGWWEDYRCIATHVSAAGYGVLETIGTYWMLRGPAAIASGGTPVTNVSLTLASTWTSGAAVSADAVVFDASDSHEYVAAVALSSAENTIRPSLAVKSLDRLIAARWMDRGAGNAWAPFDYDTGSMLRGINSSGTIVDPAFSIAANPGYHNRIAFSGLTNVESIQVKVYVAGSLTETKTATLTLGKWGIRPETAVIDLSVITTAALLEVTLTRATSTIIPTCGKVVYGFGYELGLTRWDVETGILSFSRKDRDPVYGTVKLLKRKSAKRLRASSLIKASTATGDEVHRVLSFHDGRTAFFDFNNTGTTYDRMRLFGFLADFSISPINPTNDLLTISVEGLVGT